METPTPPPAPTITEAQKIQQQYASLCAKAGDFYFKLKGLEYEMLSMQNAYSEAVKKETPSKEL